MYGPTVRLVSAMVIMSLVIGTTCLVVPKRAHAESPLSNNVKSGYFKSAHKDSHTHADKGDDHHTHKKQSHSSKKLHRMLHSTHLLDEACGEQNHHDTTTVQPLTVVALADHLDIFTSQLPTVLGTASAQSPPRSPLHSKVQLLL